MKDSNVQKDKYSAIWVSHSSISDFLNCPRAYYLNNVYRDPHTRHKMTLVSPPLALGQAVHEVIESLSILPVKQRFKEPLSKQYEKVWKNVSGKLGGFPNLSVEEKYKQRGLQMLARVTNNPGPINNLAIKINMDLPYYWLSEKDNIILCGKVDWLEYIPEDDSVHIIDFKTSKHKEDNDSLQLPIYHLLVTNTQNRTVSKASYWYLEFDDSPKSVKLPNLDNAYTSVLKIAKEIKTARQLERFKCKHVGGCSYCKPFEAILRGEGELVGTDRYDNDLYIVNTEASGKQSSLLH